MQEEKSQAQRLKETVQMIEQIKGKLPAVQQDLDDALFDGGQVDPEEVYSEGQLEKLYELAGRTGGEQKQQPVDGAGKGYFSYVLSVLYQ